MNPIYFILYFFLVCCLNGFGQSDAAIKYYDQKKYNEALLEWNKLIVEGAKGEELYYNIANTYYRMNQYPKAILFYNKALKWNPNCKGCKINLRLAQKATGVESFELPEFILSKLYHNLLLSFQPLIWLIAGIVLMFGFLFVFLFKKNSSLMDKYKPVQYLIVVISIICLILAWHRDLIKHSTHEVILMNPSGLHLSPDENSESKQELVPGQALKITDRLSGWIKVQTKEFDLGWVEESKVEVVGL